MAVSTSEAQPSFSIIDPEMTVRAMRDSGYKSTTHALAELIDNSIESLATTIEVFGVSRRDDRTGRYTLQELAVLDNGEGMDGDTLRGSLRYVTVLAGSGEGSAGSASVFPIPRCRKLDEWTCGRGNRALRTLFIRTFPLMR